jgi:hypothetical protein
MKIKKIQLLKIENPKNPKISPVFDRYYGRSGG